MEARVVVGDDLAVAGAHDEDGLLADRVFDEIPRIRHLLLTACDLPDARPQPFHLEVEEGLGDVTILGHEAVLAD